MRSGVRLSTAPERPLRSPASRRREMARRGARAASPAGRHRAKGAPGHSPSGFASFAMYDPVTKVSAFVADEHFWPSD